MTRRTLYDTLARTLLPLGWEHAQADGYTLARPYDGRGYCLCRVTDATVRPIVCVHVRETRNGGSAHWSARFSTPEAALLHLGHVKAREEAMAQRA